MEPDLPHPELPNNSSKGALSVPLVAGHEDRLWHPMTQNWAEDLPFPGIM